MNQKQRKEQPDFDLARRGMIPWSREEFYEVYAKYRAMKLRHKNKNAPGLLLLVETFQKEYPNKLEFMAHIYRLHLIPKFIFKYGRRMGKDGLGDPEGEAGFRDELMDVLCALPFSKAQKGPNGKKFYTFSYSEVKNEALKKINAHLN